MAAALQRGLALLVLGVACGWTPPMMLAGGGFGVTRAKKKKGSSAPPKTPAASSSSVRARSPSLDDVFWSDVREAVPLAPRSRGSGPTAPRCARATAA